MAAAARPIAILAAVAAILAHGAVAALSPDDYHLRTSMICAKFNTQRQIALGKTGTDWRGGWTKVLAISRRRHAALGALAPPPPLASKHRRALKADSTSIAALASFVALPNGAPTGVAWANYERLLNAEASAWFAAGDIDCLGG